MNWNDNTLNPKKILGYFENVPSTKHVQLHRLVFLRDGPAAEITFDLTEFPQNPSSKWPMGANTCQITIRALGLSEVSLTRWGTGVSGELAINKVSGALEVSFSGEGHFKLLCSHVDIVSVSGYINNQN
ncbi:MAG: immunity 50 family protein [Gammaproteobacteria bacterium]|nr:immunity 50 family protein [Gammaproteobacteria bacterium]